MAGKVTGARTEVELTVEVSPEKLWEIITDVSRIGEFSPECKGGAWLDHDSPGPRVGARFSGRNEFGNGFVGEVTCVVTESEPGRVFTWVVLDGEEDPARPGTTWRYELSAAEFGGTMVRQTFVHGPGDTGLRVMVAELTPAAAEAGVQERLDQIREHMTETITAMAERG
ncbi:MULTISPECIES: SRPBCC family protein [unclassified Crossiella]|uniref:SRPBCC family protein n=1 Tax=unclassified Crossiella TaxID=2620835 RepID=UPI001FFEA733|nr:MULTISPECIES: SRPBCC family protein [unclassified Crossiella]MCK2238775.1 SRPBCC family protein [Crossiella sp. S99.2]MCK2251655.1 SRPBCC family protein [Crossiella sp. S99.1]